MRIQPISARQIKKIKAVQRAVGLEDDDYRAMLWNLAKVKSCKDLRGVQVDLVIRHLERCAGPGRAQANPPRPPLEKRGEKRPLWATAAQREEIKKRWGRISRVAQEWGAESRQTHDSLKNFLRRRFKTTMDWLTLPVAQKVIEALKGMQRRGPAAPGEKASL